MNSLPKIFVFFISLTFLLPSCDPDFAVDLETCFFLATCTEGGVLSFHHFSKTCFCECEPIEGRLGCGNRCQFEQSDCKGNVRINTHGDGKSCECVCPDGWENPPNCDILKGTYAYDWFNMWASPSFGFRQGASQESGVQDYFPLNEGHLWKYAAYDSTGMNVVSSFAYGIVDTFQLDTLDTIRIYDFSYFFFDTTDNVVDTLMGLMLYNDSADSNKVYNFSNNDSPFILHHMNFGDTLFEDGPDFTVVDSLGTIAIAAGTFNDCIWLRNQDSSGQVLAPNVGIIQMLDRNKKVLELSNYFIHCEFHVEIDTLSASDCNSGDGEILLKTFGDTTSLSYQWTGPTAVGNSNHAKNLNAGYYTVRVSNGSCTNVFDSIPVAGCASLPVELIDFSAKPFDQHVLLEWSTRTEINNDYFLLEHSLDGRTYFPVERIKGAGTSYKLREYQFLHKEAIKGINFYRLKQVDFGGLYEYSNVIAIQLTKNITSIFPNPVVERMRIISTVESFDIRLLQLDGKSLIKQHHFSGEYLDVSGFSPGMYLLEIMTGNSRELHPVVILD